jgi:hypothetical protein
MDPNNSRTLGSETSTYLESFILRIHSFWNSFCLFFFQAGDRPLVFWDMRLGGAEWSMVFGGILGEMRDNQFDVG